MCRVVAGSDCEEVSWWPGAFYYDDAEPGKHPLHAAGAYYIQEPSAMLPVTMLDVNDSGQKVLDLCAAPGGKSTQIADLMCGRGLLVSNEIIPSRASVLSENMERMGAVNALVLNEEPAVLAERFPAFFDRILVDAPCSGEGMFRKNPEAANEWSPENVEMCAKRQDMLLDVASSMLAAGGKIVYSTCTFAPSEDEGAMERFLASHPEFEVADGPEHIYPHTHKGEGHFAVSFVRSAERDLTAGAAPWAMPDRSEGTDFAVESKNAVKADKYRGSNRKSLAPDKVQYALLCSFLEEALKPESDMLNMIINNKDRLTKFGDSLYLAPEYMPDLNGLKVYRAGLKLGTFAKNRFEPDHALAHALCSKDTVYAVDLDPNSREATQYLVGMTLPCDPSIKGWCLVCVSGLPLGWGKASGGTIKNHYPKGLRIK